MFFYIAKGIVWAVLHLVFSLKTEGKENVPKKTALIYAANHRSNADPPIIGCVIPGRISFMAKEELFRNRFFAALIKSLGAFPVSRGKGDTAVLDKSVDCLKNGSNLMIFPEGTRSKDGKVHRGHSGAAVIAARSGNLVVPVGIVFGEKLKFRSKVTVKFGKPIDPSEYVEISDAPNPRQLVRLKNRYMADIRLLVEGENEKTETAETAEIKTEATDNE